jgi:hypothetical protein
MKLMERINTDLLGGTLKLLVVIEISLVVFDQFLCDLSQLPIAIGICEKLLCS